MTTRPHAERIRPAPTTEPAPEPTADARPEPGFVLHVGVDDSFGHGPEALRDLVEAAETLQELARDLLPQAETFTTLSLTPPAAD